MDFRYSITNTYSASSEAEKVKVKYNASKEVYYELVKYIKEKNAVKTA